MMTKREYERISRAGRHSWFGVPAREGYTLLEVLMAVSLTTLLLAAITMTTGSFVQLSTRSRQHLQQAAMADCLVEDLMLDLRRWFGRMERRGLRVLHRANPSTLSLSPIWPLERSVSCVGSRKTRPPTCGWPAMPMRCGFAAKAGAQDFRRK